MAKRYDLIVVGTGTAASTVAMQVRDAGWQVCVIDHRPFGGTCALRGCDPKKVLIGGANAVDHAYRMHGKGVAGTVHIDWHELMSFKGMFTDPVPQMNEQRYADKGIDAYHGEARFTGQNSVQVDGQELEGKYILIASGAEPVQLGIPGEEYLLTNEDFLSLPNLPKRIVLVGGGYIAAEFSHIAARAGSQVTILQHGKQMLKQFDPDLVGWLMASFKAQHIDVRTGASVEGIEKKGDSYCVRASEGEKRMSIVAAMVVHAAGRGPAFDMLNLEVAGIELEHGRLKLNDYLQSVSNPAVYAAGDAAQKGPPLTPVASHDAKVVAANLLNGNQQKPDYRGVPSVAFTIPPIARVGMSESEARQQGIRFRMKSERATDWFTARQAAESVYGFKVLVEEATDRVLGAHLVGPHAEEVINLFALAIRHGISASDLRSTIFSYPTGASDIAYML